MPSRELQLMTEQGQEEMVLKLNQTERKLVQRDSSKDDLRHTGT